MEFKDVLVGMRSAWWLPAVGLIAGAVAALLIALAQTPLYTSHTRLYVSATATSSLADAYQGSQLSQARMMSYAELVTSHRMTDRIAGSLELSTTADELASRISARAVPDTVLLDITVTHPSPQRAFDIAEAVGAEFNVVVAQLEASADGPQDATNTPVRVSVVTPPEVPTTASSPRTQRNVALGAVLGLLAGIAASVTRSSRHPLVRDPEQAALLTGVPVLGTVRSDRDFEQHPLFVHPATTTGLAEDYRQLRTNLQHLAADSPPKTVMVTSAGPAEGKTALVVNLALAFVESGRRVTIVEADLRRPRITRYLGFPEGSGLTGLLTGRTGTAVAQRYADKELWAVPAGPLPADAGELLASARLVPLIERLREENDVVLIDTPPLLAVADASGLAATVDGVLLVARYGQTYETDLEHARRTLDRVGARTLGLVLTVVPPRSGDAAVDASRFGYEPDSVHSTPWANHRAGETPPRRVRRPRPTTSPLATTTAPDGEVPAARPEGVPTDPAGLRSERRPA